jgi:hypothetical protein
MISPISSNVVAEPTQALSLAAKPPTPSTGASDQLAPDTVSISAAGQLAAAGDVDHDGDSH